MLRISEIIVRVNPVFRGHLRDKEEKKLSLKTGDSDFLLEAM